MSLDTIKHYPVMLSEVTNFLSDNKSILDCTFGGGGYSSEILKKYSNSKVIALDRDIEIIKLAEKLEKKYLKRFVFKNIKFSELHKVKELKEIDYFIFDLGVSHFQLKDMKRGFSFRSDDSLSMSMGLSDLDAEELIRKASEKDLKNILKFFGEEKFASMIASKIVNVRKNQNISSGKQLAEIIETVKFKKSKIHPSTKSFQALRMIVNQELSEIYKSLKFIIENCKENSTVIVVTFHSLEDLLVKKIMNFYGKNTSTSRYLPQSSDIKKMPIKILTNKALKPNSEEVNTNPSSRSAKLRAFTKICKPDFNLKRSNLDMEKYFSLEELYV
jgi:16S rRNA (cytosine1402-N4)-methyltransferase